MLSFYWLQTSQALFLAGGFFGVIQPSMLVQGMVDASAFQVHPYCVFLPPIIS